MSCRTAGFLRGALTIGVIVLFAAAVLGDEPGPGPRPNPPAPKSEPNSDGVPLHVFFIPQAAHSVLVIPKKFLPAEKAALNEAPPAAPSVVRNVIAAVALSCGIAGLFLVRRNQIVRTAVVATVCLAAIAVAARLMANVGPPQQQPSLPPYHPKAPAPEAPLKFLPVWPNEEAGKVTIEVADDGDSINLFLTSTAAEKLRSARPASPEPAGTPSGAAAPTP